jgi:hypothetical protein
LSGSAQSSANVIKVGAALVVEHSEFKVEITPAMAFAQCDLLSRQELHQGRHGPLMGGKPEKEDKRKEFRDGRKANNE